MNKGTEWTNTEIAYLRELWTTGRTHSQIVSAFKAKFNREISCGVIDWRVSQLGLKRRGEKFLTRWGKNASEFWDME